MASGGSGGEIFLQPVGAQGPDPFTDSTATPPPVTRMPQPTGNGSAQGVRSLSGSTPGLYGGTRSVGSCDVEKQIRFLAADRDKARAFAQASGISQAFIPDYLRGLTSVVLRADTRVTNHGFSDGRATDYQSVLQVGTAVLVDNRGVPRVRCACGNPLNPPAVLRGNPGTRGRPWSGYQPTQVVVVTPAPTAITKITIINIVDNAWIERRIGDDGHHDHAVPPSDDWTRPRQPDDPWPSASPTGKSPRPHASEPDCVTPTATVSVTPSATETAPGVTGDSEDPPFDAARLRPPADASGDPAAEHSKCPTGTATAPPTTAPESVPAPSDRTPSGESAAPRSPTAAPDRSASEEPASPLDPSSEDLGPDTVPDGPDVPDGGGLIPDESPPPDSIFDAPTDVFDS
ncbi:hypothetical protein GCM10011579_021100 [Streptomyces albiflavescens]|uniref:DUF6777 domain-containing protein n=1 Tax=Streptomyces albiflavescens TaxID=1623582 RepID=A0A917XZ71_9ACTN|nr:DUF6777 domain-containing protein [Streptomyces albiflavescens]GGN58140.1 hypothetical protein GCM10011579_021100 [Streptomyces albiflavescens]